MSRRVPLLLVSLGLIVFVLAGAVLARVGDDRDAYRFLSVFGDALQLMRSHYVEELDDQTLLEGAYEGMVSGLDGFSAYLSREERAALERPLSKGTCGAVVLPGGGGAVVIRVRPGSPAADAGLKPGDQIWAIDGRPTRGRAFVQVARDLAGEPGETRVLNILDGKTFSRRELEVALTRADGDGARIEMHDPGVALLAVDDLARIDTGALSDELAHAGRRGASVLLVDLRGVVDGTPEEAARFLSLFLDGGPALTVSDRRGHETTTLIPGGKVAWSRQVRLLVDRATAGAAEAVAAALRDRAGVRVSGETTFGKGSIQELLGFEDGSGVLLSTRAMKSPSGEAWNGKGLEPDERIEQEPDARRGEAPDGQLDRALASIREELADAA